MLGRIAEVGCACLGICTSIWRREGHTISSVWNEFKTLQVVFVGVFYFLSKYRVRHMQMAVM